MTNHFINACMWTIAIAYVLTDRLLWPFIRSVFTELTTEVPAAIAPPVLAVAVTDAPALVEAAVKPRPRRRRTTSSKAAA